MIMNGQLSHGLPWLTTAGNRIVNASTGAPVLLRGLNRSGLEYSDPDEQGFLSGAGICRAEVQAIVKEWGSNIVRLPFNQDFVLRGRNGLPPEQYQQALDQVIAWNAMFGAYTLLDLQWLDTQRIYGGARNFIAPSRTWSRSRFGRRSPLVIRKNPQCFTTSSPSRTTACRTIHIC
jgi:endoglucanase